MIVFFEQFFDIRFRSRWKIKKIRNEIFKIFKLKMSRISLFSTQTDKTWQGDLPCELRWHKIQKQNWQASHMQVFSERIYSNWPEKYAKLPLYLIDPHFPKNSQNTVPYRSPLGVPYRHPFGVPYRHPLGVPYNGPSVHIVWIISTSWSLYATRNLL